ncbi:MAG: hypothetical protein KAS32_07065 [Candidatus Peribacteraceae bacterium]|nr:hypothetical protein [Candidatus Peribacteraceae bacterium]
MEFNFRSVMILIVLHCLGIVGYVGYMMTYGGMTADEIFGLPIESTSAPSIAIGADGRVVPLTELDKDDIKKECMECHLDTDGMPVSDWVIEKYGLQNKYLHK